MSEPRKARILRAFGRARDYDVHAGIQRIVADRLADRIAALEIDLDCPALELGCGTGFLTARLRLDRPAMRLTASDITPAMVERTRARIGASDNLGFAVVDAENLPQGFGDYGLIASSLTFQWIGDLQKTLDELADRLAPGGWLAFSTLLAGTFREWTAARTEAGLDAATRAFPDKAALAAMLPKGMGASIDDYPLIDRHETALGFVRSLKAIGAESHWENAPSRSAAGLRHAMRLFEESGSAVTYEVAQVVLRRKK
jgi:malonyl-CoA O-methyltransferase